MSRPVAYASGAALLILLTLLGLYLLSSRMSALEESERVDEERGTDVFNRLRRLHHRFPLLTLLMDVVLVAIAYFGAYLVRWDTPSLPTYVRHGARKELE